MFEDPRLQAIKESNERVKASLEAALPGLVTVMKETGETFKQLGEAARAAGIYLRQQEKRRRRQREKPVVYQLTSKITVTVEPFENPYSKLGYLLQTARERGHISPKLAKRIQKARKRI